MGYYWLAALFGNGLTTEITIGINSVVNHSNLDIRTMRITTIHRVSFVDPKILWIPMVIYGLTHKQHDKQVDNIEQ